MKNLSGQSAESAVPLSARRSGDLWRRALALLIDCAVLLMIGAVLGHVAFGFLIRIGRAAPAFGCAVATAYFGLLNSAWGGGGTLGKRLMRLEIVDRHGRRIGVVRSIARTLIVAIPWFHAGWPWGSWIVYSLSGFGIRLAEVMIPLSTAYLVIFNRPTHQGLHDLLAGGYVVDSTSSGPVSRLKPWWGHFAVIGLAIAGFTYSFLNERADLMRRRQSGSVWSPANAVAAEAILKTIDQLPLCGDGSIGGSFFGPVVPATKPRVIEVSVERKVRIQDSERFAAGIAALVLRLVPDAATADSIEVTVSWRYNMGIGRSSVESKFAHTPAEWKERPGAVSVPQ